MTTTPADAHKFAGPTSLFVPVDWVPITPGAGALDPPLRAIRANAAGTVTCKMADGSTSRTLNFLAGETRLGIFTYVTAATATGLEGGI